MFRVRVRFPSKREGGGAKRSKLEQLRVWPGRFASTRCLLSTQGARNKQERRIQLSWSHTLCVLSSDDSTLLIALCNTTRCTAPWDVLLVLLIAYYMMCTLLLGTYHINIRVYVYNCSSILVYSTYSSVPPGLVCLFSWFCLFHCFWLAHLLRRGLDPDAHPSCPRPGVFSIFLFPRWSCLDVPNFLVFASRNVLLYPSFYLYSLSFFLSANSCIWIAGMRMLFLSKLVRWHRNSMSTPFTAVQHHLGCDVSVAISWSQSLYLSGMNN